MSLLAYIDSPSFAPGCDMQTTDGLATLWDNIRVLDMASLAPRDAFCGNSEHRHEYVRTNPLPLWRGGFRYRAGLTALSLYVDMSAVGTGVTARVRVTVNGAVRIDAALGAGLNLYTATGMGGWGLTDGQVAEVGLEIYDAGLGGPDLPSGRVWGRYYIVDMFVGPASAILSGDAWPGVPTFDTSGPTEAKLLQLSNAADWLARRMNAVPQPLFQRLLGTSDGIPTWTQQAGEPDRHLWSGGVIRGPFDRLRIRVVWVASRTATTQRIRLKVGGAEVATTPSWPASGWGYHDFDFDLSPYGAASPLRVELEYVVTGPDLGSGNVPPRLTVEWAEVHRSAPAFSVLSDRPVSWESTDWATRRARLNQMAAVLGSIKARIDADGDRWDRIRLFRESYSYDRKEAEILQGQYHAVRRYRAGTRLIVRGSNIKLGWGPVGYKLKNPKEPFGQYEFTWGSEEALVSGSEVQTKEVLLDALDGLEPGFQYTVYGPDCRYAGEELR